MKLLAASALLSILISVQGQLFAQTVFKSDSLNLDGKIITPEFSSFVEGLLNASQIHGLSLVIVNKDGKPELGNWGARSEEGDGMTSKVRIYYHLTALRCS